jgi:hypothetical protein
MVCMRGERRTIGVRDSRSSRLENSSSDRVAIFGSVTVPKIIERLRDISS